MRLLHDGGGARPHVEEPLFVKVAARPLLALARRGAEVPGPHGPLEVEMHAREVERPRLLDVAHRIGALERPGLDSGAKGHEEAVPDGLDRGHDAQRLEDAKMALRVLSNGTKPLCRA